MGNTKITPRKTAHASYLERLAKESGLSTSEVYNWLVKFKENATGDHMSKEAFTAMYAQLMPGKNTNELVEVVFRTFDINRDGTIDFEEFLSRITVSSTSPINQKLKRIFDLYDKNKDGYITREEMQSIILTIVGRGKGVGSRSNFLGQPVKSNLKRSAMNLTESIFKKMDVNRDDKITFQEFKASVEKDKNIMNFLSLTD